MKKIFYPILAAAAILTGCNRELIEQEGKGSLSLNLDCKTDYTEVETKASQTEEEIINSLAIDITSTYNPAEKYHYPAFSEIKGKVIELGSGSYTLTASSPVKKDAAFDQPIFEGSKGFVIKTGEVTSIDLTCTISNIMVSVVLSENFVKELSDYTVTVSNGKGSLSWTKAAGADTDDFEPAADGDKTVYKGKKAGYFTVAPLTVTVDGHRKADGSTATTKYNIASCNAADHHILKLDAKVTGSLSGINISVSNEVKPIDQAVVVPGFEEKPVPGDKPNEGGEGDDNGGDGGNEGTDEPEEPSTAPTLIWEANPDFDVLDLPVDPKATVDVELEIEAPEGIKQFIIYVDSPILSPVIHALTAAGEDGEDMENGIAVMDMIYDDVLYVEGIPMKDEVLNKTHVSLSLSKLVPMINLYKPAVGTEHIFDLYVLDNKDQVLEQSVTIVSVAAN